MPNRSGHGEDGWGGVTGIAEGTVSAAMYVVFANEVFAGEGMLVVSRAFVQQGTSRTATRAFVLTGFHFQPHFHHERSVPRFGKECEQELLDLITKGSSW